ncbi:NEDD8-activating enzyme E1 regulatory subunit-like [Acipenser ruthenus]|uniref:NEDD8-activating enzyme E1 regulatory subunit-like n=1 Tax=Acipenser ruthenus TaxID=7906 RepID=UPI00274296DF|nr:NEDD8-activating enzyme E1 regulatory subunit-like [Acipenser ruthenus]
MFRESARALCKRKRKRNEFKSGSVDMASVDKGKATKEQKYDRQLRLWGDHGQDALENAHVCLINASATGTEILKNLVLPGIGAFTIVDENKVRGEDVGNNFFLTKSSIGRNRAQAATELLQELNSDVSGNFVEESPDQLLDNDPDFFHRFSLVIAVHLPESTLLRLAAFVWGAGVPLLVCRTYGLIGYMRLVVKEHTVVESHPDNALEDLRLDHPFPELKKHIQSYDLENMEKRDHSHTPWIIVMAKYLEKWRSEHNKQMPKSYKEKEAFRELIRQGIRKNENGVPEDEENFDEAIKNVNTALNPTKISSGVEELLQDENSKNIKAQTSSFWLLVRALKEFVEKEGQGSLPVRGTIPDMIADSDKFIKLQNVYREKAKEDATAVSNHISALLQSVGRLPESVSEQEIRLFCKSSAFLRVVRCRSLAEEYSTETINKDEISSCMDNPDSEMVLYLMLRAVDKFYQQHGRYPGVYNYQVEEDIGKLKSCVNSFLQENGLAVNVKHDYIHEFCRYGAVEPHPVASFVGGSAAQEAIKIITHQFVPFNNTFIYNAMAQTSATFQL